MPPLITDSIASSLPAKLIFFFDVDSDSDYKEIATPSLRDGIKGLSLVEEFAQAAARDRPDAHV